MTMAFFVRQTGLHALARHPMAHGALALLMFAALLQGAQAASVQEQSDLLQPGARVVPAGAGTTLDRALHIDLATGQRNLDLLLETRGAAAEPSAAMPPAGTAKRGDAAAASRQGAAAPGTVPTALGTVLPPTPLGLQTAEALASPRSGGSRSSDGHTWLGALPAGQGGLIDSRDAGSGAVQARGDDVQLGELDPVVRRLLVSDALQFLRDNRWWLLASVGLVAALAAAAQAYTRRR